MADGLSFEAAERERAARWKRWSSALPEAAREPGPYAASDGVGHARRFEFCLPREHACLSLLPEVRAQALALFATVGARWHGSVDGGPSNHLLSSQVQCANALGRMVSDPARLVRAFGPVLGTRDVLEIEPGRVLTFEYIGDVDFFGEGFDGVRVRGSMCTSVDAAFLHCTVDGVVELILVEWKYTESYRRRTVDVARDATRWQRYGTALMAPDGPVRGDLLPFDEVLQEPLYQLVRQQLLAWELEKSRAHRADRVRVVMVAPSANLAYQGSLYGLTVRMLGESVSEVWQKLLRRPDRFVTMDSAVFTDPDVTSIEYAARYGDTLSVETT
jgi:hypothetical protein